MQQQNDAEVVERVKGLFEWTFQVQIPYEAMAWIVDLLRLSWHDGDPSERELITYLVQLHVHLSGLAEPALSETRPRVLELFHQEFADMELNDRGRVLVMFRGLLETLSPGCTHRGVEQGRAQDDFLSAVLSQEVSASPQVATGPQASPQASSAALGLGLGAAAPATPAPAPAPEQPQATTHRDPTGEAMPGVPDMLQMQMQMQEQQQALMMQSMQSKRMHETMMAIINNMG